MMSVGFSSLPVIFLIASSRRVLSYVMSIAIDDGTARDDAEHVAVVHQLFRDLLNRSAHAAGVVELQVQVVDEEQERCGPTRRSAGRVGGRMMPSGGGGGGGASTLVTRPPVTTVIDVMSCLTPSS